MKKRNLGSFAVAPHLIEKALQMPDGHEIVGAEWDFASRTVRLFVEGQAMPEVEPGEIVPSITPMVTVAVCDDGRRVHTWHLNSDNSTSTPTPPAGGA